MGKTIQRNLLHFPHLKTNEEKTQSTEEICTAELWIFQIGPFSFIYNESVPGCLERIAKKSYFLVDILKFNKNTSVPIVEAQFIESCI